MAVNGKVVEMTNIEEMKKAHPKDTMRCIKEYAGKYTEPFFSQYFFDPKGSRRSTNIADFTQRERDFLEDKLIHFTHKNPGNRVIALI